MSRRWWPEAAVWWAWIVVLVVCAVALRSQGDSPHRLRWSNLPDLPDAHGFGGPMVGLVDDVLLVVGGANFPNGSPWEGGTKTYYDTIFALEPDADEWRRAGRLPHPLAYGCAFSTVHGLVIAGGIGETESSVLAVQADCYLVRYDASTHRASVEPLPALPAGSAFGAGGSTADRLLLAGGSANLQGTQWNHRLYALEITTTGFAAQWTVLPPWPGPARHKSVAVVQQQPGSSAGAFFLFSGEIPGAVSPGSARTYDYRVDAYRYEIGTGRWSRIADLPVPMAAGCAAAVGTSHALVFSGSAGEHIDTPASHPGFPRVVHAYHMVTDTWSVAGSMPEGVVTTEVVRRGNAWIVPSGEVRPGVRTRAVRLLEIERVATGFGWLDISVLGAYLFGLVLVGVLLARRSRDDREFFLAGRRVPWWAAGISIFATQLSAITFVATPAVAFATNWAVLPGKVAILLMAPIVVAFYLPYFRELNVVTAYEFLERRFSLAVRLVGSAAFISFQLIRMAVVLFLPALALARITGLDVYLCIGLMGVLATLYTAVGGMAAVIWTDVVQTIVLLGGMVAAIFAVVVDAGGVSEVIQAASEYDKMRLWLPDMSWTELASWSILLGTFALQFGPYTTDQSVIQRYLTTPTRAQAARGIWLNGWLALPAGLLFMALGTCLWVYYRQHPEALPVGMSNDEVFPLFVAGQLPVGLSGLVVAGIFAASMSSLDSSMHSIATACSVDWYQRFAAEPTEAGSERLARSLIVVLGALAVGTACALVTFDIQSLWFFFQSCIGLISSGLVGIFLLGVMTKRAHATGVLVGAGASLLTVAGVTYWTPLHFYLYPVIGISIAVTVGYLVSAILPCPEASGGC